MEGLRGNINKIEYEMKRIEKGISDVNSIIPAVAQLNSQNTKEHLETRELINEFGQTILGQVSHNQILENIESELPEDTESLIWFGDSDEYLKPQFKLSSLNMTDDMDMNSRPSVSFQGVDLTSTASAQTIDEIHSKPAAAHCFNKHLSKIKRRRPHDLTPFHCVVKSKNYFQILREYMPPALIQKLRNKFPTITLGEFQQTSRGLAQEYRIALLDRFARVEHSALPKVSVTESLERAMLALHTEQVKVELGFYFAHLIGGTEFTYDLRVNISRYEI